MHRVFPGCVVAQAGHPVPAGFSFPPVSVATARWTGLLGNRVLDDVPDHFQIFSLRPVL